MARRKYQPEFKRRVVEEQVKADRRIAELEVALGWSALEVDFLKRAFQRAGFPFPSGVRS